MRDVCVRGVSRVNGPRLMTPPAALLRSQAAVQNHLKQLDGNGGMVESVWKERGKVFND